MKLRTFGDTEGPGGTWAFVMNGNWNEHGKMGWFCSSSDRKDDDVWDEFFSQQFAAIDPDKYITVVDCHI